MKALFTFKQLKKGLSNTCIPLVCIIVIILLTASCSTVSNKQTTSTNTASNSLTAKEKSDNEKTESEMDKLECRTVVTTGSRFKKKICEYKETWAAIDKKNQKDADKFVKGIDEQSGIVNSSGTDASGGTMNTPMTPGGM